MTAPLFATAPGKGSRELYLLRWIKRDGNEESRTYFSRVHLVRKVNSLAEEGLPMGVWLTGTAWHQIDPATLTVTTREA